MPEPCRSRTYNTRKILEAAALPGPAAPQATAALPIPLARAASSRQLWPKLIRPPRFRNPFPPRHSYNYKNAPGASGVTEQIPNKAVRTEQP